MCPMFQRAIANAKTLQEVEKLQAMLAINQIPGHTTTTTNGSSGGEWFTGQHKSVPVSQCLSAPL